MTFVSYLCCKYLFTVSPFSLLMMSLDEQKYLILMHPINKPNFLMANAFIKKHFPSLKWLRLIIVLLFTLRSISAQRSVAQWLFVNWPQHHGLCLSMEFSRQEFCSRLPFPIPGELSDPGIEITSLASPASAGRFSTTSATWEALRSIIHWEFLYTLWGKGQVSFFPTWIGNFQTQSHQKLISPCPLPCVLRKKAFKCWPTPLWFFILAHNSYYLVSALTSSRRYFVIVILLCPAFSISPQR